MNPRVSIRWGISLLSIGVVLATILATAQDALAMKMLAPENSTSGVANAASITNVLWVMTGSMITPGPYHSATLLPNGKVLVAGGFDGATVISRAELYDPAKGKWSSTASMHTARESHHAIVLPNGNVLVMGGDTRNASISTAELFNPSKSIWTDTGAMNIGRYSFAAVLLSTGKVLVAGGWDMATNRAISSAELYDPASGTWSYTGSMNFGRNATTAILLDNGNVLIAGGEDILGMDLNSAELYDPASGTWSLTNPMNANHGHYNPLVKLADGRVMITGTASSSSCEIYDPIADTWSDTGSMNVIRRNHMVVLLQNGKVLAAGGSIAFTGPTDTSSAEIYDPATGQWTTISPMNFTHYSPTATKLANGKILVTGGDYSTGAAELFSFMRGNKTGK